MLDRGEQTTIVLLVTFATSRSDCPRRVLRATPLGA
jgi:hypothetical protein